MVEFVVHEILWPKIKSQDSYLDDEVLSLSDSDSNILAMVEKADFVDFSDDDCSTLDGSEG